MTSGPISSLRSSHRRPGALALLAVGMPLLAACTSIHDASSGVAQTWWTQIVRPAKYRVGGIDPEVRANLTRGQQDVEAMNYRDALVALNRALWDVELIQGRSLRLAELAEVHEELGYAYAGLGKADVAQEHRRIVAALTDAATRAPAPEPAATLARAKDAYAAARFREALTMLRAALIDLEDVSDRETRVHQLAEARCYLAFTYFAGEDRERVSDELLRLAAMDGTLSTCAPEAPPGVRALMPDVLGKRP
jgi:tetratricopeptide (TPR) repeat protein